MAVWGSQQVAQSPAVSMPLRIISEALVNSLGEIGQQAAANGKSQSQRQREGWELARPVLGGGAREAAAWLFKAKPLFLEMEAHHCEKLAKGTAARRGRSSKDLPRGRTCMCGRH